MKIQTNSIQSLKGFQRSHTLFYLRKKNYFQEEDFLFKMEAKCEERVYLLNSLDYLLSLPSRKERNDILGVEEKRKELLPCVFDELYENFREKEYHHIRHVRACHSALVLQQTQEYDGALHHCPAEVEIRGISLHDHTKDEFYFFVTILAFGFNLREDLPENLFQGELDRHFTLEPHHPEYEKLNAHKGLRIKDRDIAEMAIDRLSRNLQFNSGKYNQEQIEKYEPRFLFDHERRIELYRKKV